MSLYPTINLSGVYQLAAPFDSVLLPNRSYTCIAVRRYADIRLTGVDPFATYYQPYSIPQTVYEDHESQNAAIVTLVGGMGETYYIPSPYILSFPSQDGVPYAVMGLSVQIGALYTGVDLTALKEAVKDAVQNYIGQRPAADEVNSVLMSAVTYVSSDAHAAAEAARLDAIEVSTTPSAELVRLRNANVVLQDRIAELEAYIIAHA